jgi:cysteine desulfurase
VKQPPHPSAATTLVGWSRIPLPYACLMIYLDHNATTDPLPEVVAAVTASMQQTWANPSSMHRHGQEARRAIELSRQHVAALLSDGGLISPKQITFVSSGTEAIDLTIRGALPSRIAAGRGVLATTAVEHAAVRDLAQELSDAKQASPLALRTLPLRADQSGVIDLEAIDRAGLIDASVGLVSVQWANNETGVIQPIQALAKRCRAVGAWLHVDATQWVGKMPTELCEMDGAMLDVPWCDLLTFAPHKFHGPQGVGVLYVRKGINLRPQILGTQESSRRGGTENVPAIIATGVACQAAQAFLAEPSRRQELAQLRDRFEQRVVAIASSLGIQATIIAQHAPLGRLWNTSNIAFATLESEALLLAFSERGLCASAGAACSSGSLEPSPVLRAMGLEDRLTHGAIRFSLSRFTTLAMLDEAVAIIDAALRRVAGSSSHLASPASASTRVDPTP